MKQENNKGIPCTPGGWNWLFMQEPKQEPKQEQVKAEEITTIKIRWDSDSAQAVQDVEPPTTAK